MESARIEYEPGRVPRKQRERFWSDAFSSLYGPVRVDSLGADSIDGRIGGVQLWKLKLFSADMSRHRIALPQALARPGTHLLMKVHFQTRGVADFEQDGRVIRLQPGHCLVYNVSRPHVMVSEEPSGHDAVIIPNELIRRQSVPIEMLRARELPDDAMARFAHDMVRAFLRDPPPLPEATAASLADGLLSLLNACFSQGVIGPDGFTSPAIMRWRAKNYIEDHLRETALAIDDVAAALGCSKRYIHTIFRDEGTSIGRYIWRLRLENSLKELESPASMGKSITDIAFSWGFSSSSHFTRLFKQQYGFPPSRLRAATG